MDESSVSLKATCGKILSRFEQNLMELASLPPQHIKCRTVSRMDSDDEKEEAPKGKPVRKQSRISNVVRPTADRTYIKGDVSNAFVVPRPPSPSSSMFRNPHHSQIDRGLYQSSMPSSESSYDKDDISGSCGSVKLGVWLDVNLNILTISLQQAIELSARRQDGRPNPYFCVSLTSPSLENNGETSKSTQKSKTYKDDASPVINEEFYFQVPPGLVEQCRLGVMVYDFDQFSVDECIGYCWLTLGRITISTNKDEPTVFWAEVLPSEEDHGVGWGEVLFSLTYLSKAQRLTVNVFKARNLRTDLVENHSSISIRISLLDNGEKRLKRKKTSSKKNTKDPQFNESLSFGVTKNSLCDIILEVEAVHEFGTFGMGCKLLGKMELPLHQCKELWKNIIHEEKSQAQWYSLQEP